jgi:putative ABC transport system permease protein
MLKHYIKIGIRNFIKHKVSSLINAFGLSVAIGCCLFVFLYLSYFLNVDDYHHNAKSIFAINRNMDMTDYQKVYAGAPDPLGPVLLEESTQVINMSRMALSRGYVKFDDKVFDERLHFTDPSFLDMFTFPMKWGAAAGLNQLNAIILSEKTSKKYFGGLNPVGNTVSIKFFVDGIEKSEDFTISGVTEKLNKKSSFRYNILLNYEKQFSLGIDKPNDWSNANNVTFIQVLEPFQIDVVSAQANNYISRYNTAQDKYVVSEFVMEPLLTSSLHSQEIHNSIFSGTATAAIITLSILATLMLTMACINYMNIAVASAAYRLKEIGVRKVIGGDRKQLIIQFFTENAIVCFIAILLGILWAEIIFIPWLNGIAGSDFIAMNYTENVSLWIFLTSLFFLTILGGAGYPSFYISKFQPVSILKDKVKFGGKNMFRKFLLGFQYFFSFITIACAIVLIQNNEYQTTIDWGYEENQVISVKIKGASNFEQFKNEIATHSNVIQVSGAKQKLGSSYSETTIEIDKKKYVVNEMNVGWSYIETMGIKVIKGRSFDENRKTDLTNSVLVNQIFIEEMGWDNALGKSFQIDNQNYNVIGETVNFHYQNFGNKIGSLIIRITTPEHFRYISAKVPDGSLISEGKAIEASWKKIFPDDPYNFYYQNTVFDRSYEDYSQVTTIITSAGTIAIFLAMIGLFGLSSLSIKAKFKEISIRKVLGGTWQHLTYILNKEFIVLLLISSLLAAPLSYFAVELLLSTLLLYTMPMTLIPFFITGLLLLLLSMLAVGGHIFKAITSNPSDSLRTE